MKIKNTFMALTLLLSTQLNAEEIGPPLEPASVNGVWHLILSPSSEVIKQLSFSKTYPHPTNQNIIFFGYINGVEVSGEILTE